MWHRRRDAIVAALLLTLPSAAAAAEGLYLEGGLSFARGDYVYVQQTSGGGATAGLAWSSSRFTARVTVPFFVRDTQLLTLSGDTATEASDPASEPDTGGYEGSVSDPLVQLYGQVYQSSRTAVGLSGSLKIPLVAAGNFGTGEWDVGGAVSLSHFVGSRTMIGADVAYWHLGDTPELPLRDVATGTLTIGQAFGGSWTASLSLSGGRSAVPGYADSWWTGLLVGRSFKGGIWGLATSVGLSDGAPDFTLGLLWRARVH
jgi:hypothetical protein